MRYYDIMGHRRQGTPPRSGNSTIVAPEEGEAESDLLHCAKWSMVPTTMPSCLARKGAAVERELYTLAPDPSVGTELDFSPQGT